MKQFLSLLLLFAACLSVQSQDSADVVFLNGKIVTVNEDFEITEAFAIKGDRILAVGKNELIKKHISSKTRTIDLKGTTVLPGLIDSHVHATGAAMYEYEHKMPAFETVEEILSYIKKRARASEDGEWITFSQVFITRLRERRYPTRKEMDKVAPKNPVYFRTGPDASVNSKAFELSGIDKNTVVPEGSNTILEKDPDTGELTGIIRSPGSIVKVAPRKNAPTFEARVDRLRLLLQDYNQVGITGISDRNASDSAIRLYQQLRKEGELSCRVFLYRGISGRSSIEKIIEKLDQTKAHPLHQYDNQLWMKGVKVFLDGGMLTGSAYMLKPWGVSDSYGIKDANYRGVRNIEPEALYQMARASLERDIQFTAHAVGDGAVETLTDTYARIAENDFPIRDKRPCVTHCNFMSERAIDTMAKHGIVADLQPAWLFLDGSTLQHHFGNDRLTWFQPYQHLFEKGVIVGGGSDHMQKIGSMRAVNPYNPFFGMWIAMTRNARWMEEPLHPNHIISRERAIQLYTINNAFLSFEEKEKGSLEAGKLADFVLIDRDILTCPIEKVRNTKVQQTWLGGKPVYDRDKLFVVSEVTEPELFTKGIEGPACDKNGNLYAVNFGEQGTIGIVSSNGDAEKYVTLPEGSIGNGIRFNKAGDMFVADYKGHNILKIDPKTKEVSVFAHEPKMHQPNDLAIGPDGTLYASDPDWKNKVGAIWKVKPTGEVELLSSGKGTTNGIEVSPDGKKLYVAESAQQRILAYDLNGDGISNETELISFDEHGLDGLRCDELGNLYVTRHGAGFILVLSSKGEVLQEIQLPGSMPSNLCFGGPDGKTVYITEVENRQILRFRAKHPGLSWKRWK